MVVVLVLGGGGGGGGGEEHEDKRCTRWWFGARLGVSRLRTDPWIGTTDELELVPASGQRLAIGTLAHVSNIQAQLLRVEEWWRVEEVMRGWWSSCVET